MASYRIREIAPHDALAVAKVWHEAWWDAHGPLVSEELKKHRHLDLFVSRIPGLIGRAAVAERDHQIAGFVAWREAELEEIFIDRKARGLGLASQLMDYGEASLRDNGVDVAWLYCVVGNVRAYKFYTKSGWKDVGRDVDGVSTPAGLVDVPVHRFEKHLT